MIFGTKKTYNWGPSNALTKGVPVKLVLEFQVKENPGSLTLLEILGEYGSGNKRALVKAQLRGIAVN